MKNLLRILMITAVGCMLFASGPLAVAEEKAPASPEKMKEAAPVAPAAETSAEKPAAQEAAVNEATAPDVFKVKFECSNGTFVIECHKDWAPIGVQRFYDLVKNGYYNDCRFFRVVPGFIVQFGINGDPAVQKEWVNKTIKDEPVKAKNLRGTITYAKSGMPNSRTTQLFINFKDNNFLDNQGFSAFGKVVEGMDVVESINPEYQERPDQGMIQSQGNSYLKEKFPNLDYIKKVTIIP